MSRFAYYSDWLTMPVLVLALVVFGGATLPGMLLGLAAWTLAEYVIHRWAFHALPWFRPAHDEHHAHPSGRTGVTSWQSLLVFGALWLAVPAGILAGLALGYLAYISVHHAVHHWRIGPTVLLWGRHLPHPLYALKMRHNAHHRGVEANFGVVTTLWDRLFRTYRPQRRGAGRAASIHPHG